MPHAARSMSSYSANRPAYVPLSHARQTELVVEFPAAPRLRPASQFGAEETRADAAGPTRAHRIACMQTANQRNPPCLYSSPPRARGLFFFAPRSTSASCRTGKSRDTDRPRRASALANQSGGRIVPSIHHCVVSVPSIYRVAVISDYDRTNQWPRQTGPSMDGSISFSERCMGSLP